MTTVSGLYPFCQTMNRWPRYRRTISNTGMQFGGLKNLFGSSEDEDKSDLDALKRGGELQASGRVSRGYGAIFKRTFENKKYPDPNNTLPKYKYFDGKANRVPEEKWYFFWKRL